MPQRESAPQGASPSSIQALGVSVPKRRTETTLKPPGFTESARSSVPSRQLPVAEQGALCHAPIMLALSHFTNGDLDAMIERRLGPLVELGVEVGPGYDPDARPSLDDLDAIYGLASGRTRELWRFFRLAALRSAGGVVYGRLRRHVEQLKARISPIATKLSERGPPTRVG